MDDIEALFGSERGRSTHSGVREEPAHVLGEVEDGDLLGDEFSFARPSDTRSIASAADSWVGGASMHKAHDTYGADAPLDDAWDEAELNMQPAGSSKLIEADDDGEFEAWMEPSRMPSTSGGAARRRRAPAPRAAAPPPTRGAPR